MAFECPHCLREFKQEAAFLRHKCKEMLRLEQMQTMNGNLAYKYYCDWMKAYRKMSPKIETFMSSRYFNPFNNFADYVKKLKIHNPERFIQLMVDKDISPMLWTRDECYSLYLEWSDRITTPYEQAQTTVNTLFKIAESKSIPIGGVFGSMSVDELVHHIQLRSLSPWVMFCSVSFKDAISKMHEQERDRLLNIIGFNYWLTKMEKNPHVVQHMQTIASEMGI